MYSATAIPDELKKLNQWVCCWNNSKVPMRAFERKAASSIDPATWSSYDQAARAVERGYYDYIGFVFADNGIVGIDIDAGFEDGLLTPLCADIMQHCQSYTEKSRSGRGVHIFLKGSLPFYGKNNLKGVEIYRARRFFIMTGKVLLFDTIAENQSGIDYVVEKYFPNAPEKSQEGRGAVFTTRMKIYSPEYKKPVTGRVRLKPTYPEIQSGGRNLSLTSLAGTMHNQGYSAGEIYRELLSVNETACKPPLPKREIQSITESITRYRR